MAFRTPTAQALATGDPVLYSTFTDFQRAHPDAPRCKARSAWAFLPLTASGHGIGSVALSYNRPRTFLPAERALLSSLAGLIAQALDRAGLYDARHALAQQLAQTQIQNLDNLADDLIRHAERSAPRHNDT
ncbi:GAF domain-containing protein [Streptomyces scopuliridis]|uniref:GAF domain-containing protein n=1 Tax=Streptomyces scopuliridis TaxID=452529 RepID=UPI00367FD455